MLIHNDVSAVAEHCLHSAKAFSVSHCAPTTSRLGIGKRLGADTGKTAEPNWSERYTTPYYFMLSNKIGGQFFLRHRSYESESEQCLHNMVLISAVRRGLAKKQSY